jgi:hypothetical protein
VLLAGPRVGAGADRDPRDGGARDPHDRDRCGRRLRRPGARLA